jgi:hypothetical protein
MRQIASNAQVHFSIRKRIGFPGKSVARQLRVVVGRMLAEWEVASNDL